MIDSVLIYTDQKLPPEGFEALSDAGHRVSDETGEVTYRSGKLKNLTVKEKWGTTTTIYGSLPRYAKGTNLEELSPWEIKETIKELEDTLHLSLRGASIYRLDIGGNLIMDQPVSAYLNLCGDAPYYQRAEFDKNKKSGGASRMYLLERRSLLLYDKLAEMKTKGQEEAIPERFQGKNVLRCEMQLKKRVKDQLGRPVKVEDLHDPQFLQLATGRWGKEFMNIRKHRKIVLTKSVKVREFSKHLALLGMKHLGGEDVVIDVIDRAHQNGTLDYPQSYRLKKKVKSLYDHEGLTKESSAARELESKIQQAATYPPHEGKADGKKKPTRSTSRSTTRLPCAA